MSRFSTAHRFKHHIHSKSLIDTRSSTEPRRPTMAALICTVARAQPVPIGLPTLPPQHDSSALTHFGVSNQSIST